MRASRSWTCKVRTAPQNVSCPPASRRHVSYSRANNCPTQEYYAFSGCERATDVRKSSMGRTAGFVRVAEFGPQQDNFIMTSRKEKGRFFQLPCVELLYIDLHTG